MQQAYTDATKSICCQCPSDFQHIINFLQEKGPSSIEQYRFVLHKGPLLMFFVYIMAEHLLGYYLTVFVVMIVQILVPFLPSEIVTFLHHFCPKFVMILTLPPTTYRCLDIWAASFLAPVHACNTQHSM